MAKIKIGDVVCLAARPGQPPSDALYKVRDLSHDKGRLFACVEAFPDTTGQGHLGSFFLEDLQLAPAEAVAAIAAEEGPGGHPPPTEAERKKWAAHREELDKKAAAAAKAEEKAAAQRAADAEEAGKRKK